MSQSPNTKGIDPAALAVAALAVAITVIAPPGPYAPGSMIVGATVLLFVFAYDNEPDDRNELQHLAFSAICAMVSVLMLGYPLELLCSGVASLSSHLGIPVNEPSKFLYRSFVLLHETRPDKDNNYSLVPPLLVIVLWFVLLCVYYRKYPKLRHRFREFVEHTFRRNSSDVASDDNS